MSYIFNEQTNSSHAANQTKLNLLFRTIFLTDLDDCANYEKELSDIVLTTNFIHAVK